MTKWVLAIVFLKLLTSFVQERNYEKPVFPPVSPGQYDLKYIPHTTLSHFKKGQELLRGKL